MQLDSQVEFNQDLRGALSKDPAEVSKPTIPMGFLEELGISLREGEMADITFKGCIDKGEFIIKEKDVKVITPDFNKDEYGNDDSSLFAKAWRETKYKKSIKDGRES